MTIHRQALRISAACLALSAVSAAPVTARTLANGLTPSEQAQLNHFRYEVSPNALPGGFHVVRFHADSSGFLIEYQRASDGAMFRISGSQAGGGRAAKPTPSPKAHGLLASLGGLFHHVTHQASGAVHQQSNAGEEEEQMTSMVIDNPYTGKYAVRTDGNCLHGDSDPSTAQYRNARYSVEGCNVNGDLFAHVVRSVKP